MEYFFLYLYEFLYPLEKLSPLKTRIFFQSLNNTASKLEIYCIPKKILSLKSSLLFFIFMSS